jgi:CheY-like chemotaxis protein
MKLLFVEDDATFVDAIISDLEAIVGEGNVVVARSRDSASRVVEDDFFDLVVLDLRLPIRDSSLDESVQHGKAVFQECLGKLPGTPVYFLTGSSADEVVTDLLRQAQRTDVWGTHAPEAMVQLLPKSRVPELLGEIQRVVTLIREMEQIEVSTGGKHMDLTWQARRLLRVFTRLRGGASCAVVDLSGGLSDARVLRVIVYNQAGVRQIVAAGKLGTIDQIEDEVARYDRHVVRLPADAYPTLLDVVKAGVKGAAGVFYRLADGYDDSLLALVARDPQRAGLVVGRIEAILRPWVEGVPTSQRPVAEIRRRVLPDDAVASIVHQFRLDWVAAFEQRPTQVRWGVSHGDLHGANVLVSATLLPMIIDFGEVGEGPSALDPVSLEMSLLFHPASSARTTSWPLGADLERWGQVDGYAANARSGEMIRTARQWAHHVAAGDREVYVCAYAYLLRQLKYPDTDKDLALTLLSIVRNMVDATY